MVYAFENERELAGNRESADNATGICCPGSGGLASTGGVKIWAEQQPAN
ncbi:hypothetical protein ES705_44600 [subsurface metagenome]